MYILGQDKELQGIASYRLGHAYEQNGDGETALLVGILPLFIQISYLFC